MLRACEKLGAVDGKSKRLGLQRTETDYLRALLDAMANMDRELEVEVLKSLGDASLEPGRLSKEIGRPDRAMILYRAAMLQCEDAEVKESLKYRNLYAAKLRAGKDQATTTITSAQLDTTHMEMSSPAKVAEKFLNMDRRSSLGCNDDSLLIEYTKLMVEGIVNEDNVLMVEAMKSCGDVYLKRGTETKDTICLTKATALYNTALARCEGVQGTAALIHRLLYTARIRQERIVNKGPKMTEQRQRHRPRIFPGVTTLNADVTPSDFVASQTPTRPTPDYRLYKKLLASGSRALADGKLDLAEQKFASALKLIHDRNKPDRPREADCLSRLGDVYVQRGKRTKDGRKFTQAAALFNAALARTGTNKHKVMKALQETEKWFLQYTANVDSKSIQSHRALRHQQILENMRARAKSELETIDLQHNPYQYDEDDPKMITVEAERAEAVKALSKSIAKDRQSFVQCLVDECIGTLGPPPCKYAFIGLGSQATELVTPYSDLEFAILIEYGNDNDDTRRYFINLTHYLHLKVINLGETILPAMAIPSLNDFQSEDPDKDWFFDSVTPRGFAFDGFMPWASKTPFGRDKTKTKPSISLIQTPNNLARIQRRNISLSDQYHLSDILRRVVLLTGEEALVEEYRYKYEYHNIIVNVLSLYRPSLSALQLVFGNFEEFARHEPTGELLNVKKDIYRFPGIAIELLAVCCHLTLRVPLGSTWDVIDRLKEMGRINEEEATHLTILTSISAELRLRTYMVNGGQRDTMSPLTEMQHHLQTHDVSDTILKSVFYIRDTKVLFRYYCRAIPLKKCMIKDCLDVQQRHVFKRSIFDNSNECRGRVARNLFLLDKSTRLLEAALEDALRDDIKRSKILVELGHVYSTYQDVTKAIHCFEQSLMISKRVHEDNTEHPDVELQIASTLERLGMHYSRQGNQMKALSYCEKSLEMKKAIYKDNPVHGNIAASLNNLGHVWCEVGDHVKAISYYEQSLTMTKTVNDNDSKIGIARVHSNLGSSWRHLGNHENAISYYEQSLTMLKTIYGEHTAHPDISKCLHGLGCCWTELHEQEKAFSYYEQSLMMDKTIYGDDTAHADVAKSLHNMGLSLSELGDDKKAILYLQQSLAMRRTLHAHGDNTAHLDIADSLHNLGISWSKLGDQKKAIDYYQESLAVKKTILGDGTPHPVIASSLNNLGWAWCQLGDQKKAISYYEKSLATKRAIHGDNAAHKDIVNTFANLEYSRILLREQKRPISFSVFQK
ncbi:uncharacterized protein LOC144871802 [Branchiostoma floridae x Branchiostoma japonicum]